jgi:Fe-S cluster biogenesis protein NfuA
MLLNKSPYAMRAQRNPPLPEVMNSQPLLHDRIEEILSQLRPYLVADQGNVSFVEVTEDMVVRVRLEGACSSCSMSMMTLKAGIEQSLIKAIPEIKAVEAI